MQVVTMLPQAILPTLPVTNLPSRTPRGAKNAIGTSANPPGIPSN